MTLDKFFASGTFRFTIWFLLILLLKHNSLFEPPSWDSVMGGFPPAVYLVENGFDLLTLLQQDNWWLGGPNVHSLSLFTWVLAAVMALTRDPLATFLIVHLLTFALAAVSMVWLVSILRSFGVTTPATYLAALVLLLCPLVLVQTGRLYMEIPLMACHIGVARLLQLGYPNRAVVVALLAVMIKLTAAALAGALFLVMLSGLRSRPLATLARCAILALGVWLTFSLPTLLGVGERHPGNWGDPALLFSQLEARMDAIPDVSLIYLLSLAAVMVIPLQWWLLRGHTPPLVRPNLTAVFSLLVPILFAVGVIAGALRGNLFLPRYLVPVLPLVLAVVVLMFHVVLPRRIMSMLLGALMVYFALNYNGRFYPPNHSSFSVVERSHQYRAFNAVKVDVLETLTERPAGIPAFVTRELYYMNSSPYMGYANPVHEDVLPVFREPYRSRRLKQYPDKFTLVKASIIHGGRVIDRLVTEARASNDYAVDEEKFSNNGYTASAFFIVRQGGQ